MSPGPALLMSRPRVVRMAALIGDGKRSPMIRISGPEGRGRVQGLWFRAYGSGFWSLSMMWIGRGHGLDWTWCRGRGAAAGQGRVSLMTHGAAGQGRVPHGSWRNTGPAAPCCPPQMVRGEIQGPSSPCFPLVMMRGERSGARGVRGRGQGG